MAMIGYYAGRYWGMDGELWWWEKSATWKYQLCLIPRKCEITNRRIFLEKAYKGTKMITGPGDPVFITKWYSKEAFITRALKGYLKWDL